MEEEIINRVAKSTLVTFNLEDYYPQGNRKEIDLAQWLWEGIALKEKDFRAAVDGLDTKPYENAYVALYCSTDAIIPIWAYMLLTIKLNGIAKKIVQGNLEQLETILLTEILNSTNFTFLKDKPVILKGCSKYPIPSNAYLLAVEKITPIAKSVMYGEACSAVPLFKKK